MIDIKGLSHQDRFRLISSIVDMIKKKKTLDTIVEEAVNMSKTLINKDKPISFLATGNAQMNIALNHAEIKATQVNTTDLKISDLIKAVKESIPPDMSNNDCKAVNEGLEVIENEFNQKKPKKVFSILR